MIELIGGALLLITAASLGYWHGWNRGCIDTERRWREAVMKADAKREQEQGIRPKYGIKGIY